MPAMTDPRELLVAELRDALFVERTLVKTLPKLAREASDDELRRSFEHHLRETEQHVANVEAVFGELGERARAERCPGIEGIKAEHDEFMESEEPSAEVCDLFLTGAAARTESHEIAAYTSLVTMAKALGEPGAAELLEENLRQEKQALKAVVSAGRRLARSAAKQSAPA